MPVCSAARCSRRNEEGRLFVRSIKSLMRQTGANLNAVVAGADGRKPNDMRHAEHMHGVDVRAVVDVRRVVSGEHAVAVTVDDLLPAIRACRGKMTTSP